MKLYGANKHQTISCKSGCCGGDLHKIPGFFSRNEEIRKAAKSRERQKAKEDIRKQMDTSD